MTRGAPISGNLHLLATIKTLHMMGLEWDKPSTNCCSISSIHSMSHDHEKETTRHASLQFSRHKNHIKRTLNFHRSNIDTVNYLLHRPRTADSTYATEFQVSSSLRLPGLTSSQLRFACQNFSVTCHCLKIDHIETMISHNTKHNKTQHNITQHSIT